MAKVDRYLIDQNDPTEPLSWSHIWRPVKITPPKVVKFIKHFTGHSSYHHANFQSDWCHRRRDICPRAKKHRRFSINVKNFHWSLTTVVKAQNDTSKTANITDTIFDRTYGYSPYKRRRFENRWDQTFCILLITDVLSVIESANLRQRQSLKQKWSGIRIRIFGLIWIRMFVVSVPKLWMHYLVDVSFRQVWYKSAVDCMRIEKTEKC